MDINIGLRNIDLNKKSMPMIFSLTKHNILYKILHQEKKTYVQNKVQFYYHTQKSIVKSIIVYIIF